MWWDEIQLEDFLSRNPSMRIGVLRDDSLTIEGEYRIHANMNGAREIEQTFSLRLSVSRKFPREIPRVSETRGQIPETSDHHINHDGSFCLGSEIKVKSILSESPDLLAFSDRILTPFLYSVSHKILFDSFPYGDLSHGEEGLVEDYQGVFKVQDKSSVMLALKALSTRKRTANKLPCPCNCGSRLGKCDYRFFISQWRPLERRRWFKRHLSQFTAPVKKKRKATKGALKKTSKAIRTSNGVAGATTKPDTPGVCLRSPTWKTDSKVTDITREQLD